MPAPARKTSNTRSTTDTPAEPDNFPEDDDITGDVEAEFNPVVIPDGWEAIPENEGGGMRPTTVPWKGYESA